MTDMLKEIRESIVGPEWIARIRADYPEATDGMEDDWIIDRYADGWKYADTWDHIGDARHDYQRLADAYLAQDAELTTLRAKLAEAERDAVLAEAVAWCQLNLAGTGIAYFEGKPMVMPGRVGNECHPTPLFLHPTPPAVREVVMALKLAREEIGGLPHSLGYEFTHLPKIDAALSHPSIKPLLEPSR